MADHKRHPTFFLVFLASFIFSSYAYQFNVGGRDGWVINPSENYNHWTGRMRFQVNDTLFFKYKKGSDSVLVVNKDDYDKCNVDKPITKLEEGNSIFKFDRSGPFYFISGNKANCDKGQKLIVVVLAIRSPPKAPAPALSPTSPTPSPMANPPSGPSTAPAPAGSSTSPTPSPMANPPSGPSPAPAPAVSPTSPTPSPMASPPSGPSPAPAPAGSTMSPSITPSPSPSSESSPPTSLPPSSSTPGSPALSPPGSSAPPSNNTPADINTPPAGSSARPAFTPTVLMSTVLGLVLSVTLGASIIV